MSDWQISMIKCKNYPRHTNVKTEPSKIWQIGLIHVLFEGAKAVVAMSHPTVSSPSFPPVTRRPRSPGPSPQNRIKEKPFLVRPRPHLSSPLPGQGSPSLVLLVREPVPRKMLKSRVEVSVIDVTSFKEPHIVITFSPIKHGQNIYSRS